MRPFSCRVELLRAFLSHPKSELSIFSSLPASSFSPQTYYQVLQSCIAAKNVAQGSQTHSRIIISGLENDSFLLTKLISLYSTCGYHHTAEKIFNRVSTCNVFLLNAMIRGYFFNGFHQEAIDVFHQKRAVGIGLDSYTFSCVLRACASLSDIHQGKELHKLAEDCAFGSDVFVCNSLICMYGKCGRLEDAIRVFNRMPQRDVVSWNSIVSAFAQNGFDLEALEKVREMVGSGLRPDQVTAVSILSMSSIIEAVLREIHGFVVRNGYESTSMIRNALLSAYGKCGRVREAHGIFDSFIQKDRITWNALIFSYAQNGLFEESMQVLRDMKLSEVDVDVVTYSGILSSLSQNNMFNEAMEVFEELFSVGLKPDVVAIASILPAISGIGSFNYCKEIHAYSYRHNLEADRRIRNALISVYGKCGSLQNAEQVFEAIKDRDVISWSSMVVGYSQNEYFDEALHTFRWMIRAKIEPNPITVTSVLSACAGISGLRQGKELHSWAMKNSLEDQAFVGSALIDMYAKCGRIKDSRRVFDPMKDKNVVTWNSMIGSYAVHGLGKDALKIFQLLREPDEVSFITILSACKHEGLVQEGIEIFNTMKALHISPREEHYACMVDLLGRSGKLEQAFELIGTILEKPSAEIWGVLLAACKIHSNLEIGMYTGERIIESASKNSGYYVLLSNMLADSARWREVELMRELMQKKGVKKVAGCSRIEVDKEFHTFVAKERAQHPEWESLHRVLNVLNEQIMERSVKVFPLVFL